MFVNIYDSLGITCYYYLEYCKNEISNGKKPLPIFKLLFNR